MQYIFVIPIETDESIWFDSLSTGIKSAFGLQLKSINRTIRLEKAYYAPRKQYDSSSILLQIIESPPSENIKILGVAEVDMFIPILTFVFGEAQLGGTGAVVSSHRLNNKYYGLPENTTLLVRRIVKESIHELGHTFGLLHCRQPGCVMNSSTYVEDIDQKSQDMCSKCSEILAGQLK